MDIVRTAVTRLGGSMTIRSTPGKSTRITLMLPLTVAMTRCLLVEIGGDTFALPQVGVKDVVTNLSIGDRQSYVEHDGSRIPLVRPERLFGAVKPKAEEPVVAVLDDDGSRCAILLDRLSGQEEIVHDPDPDERDAGILCGSAVLCNGQKVPVLDAGRIVRFAHADAT